MMELRFVKREIDVPVLGHHGDERIATTREVKILQMRTLNHVVIKTATRKWNDWEDVPLVEPEDE